MEKQYDKSQEKVRKLRIVYDRNKFNVEDILQEKKFHCIKNIILNTLIF